MPQSPTQSPPPARRARLSAAFETAAMLALALWLGGVVALGAFAAPTVFGALEGATAGAVMGAIFAKFERAAVVLMGVFLVAEVARGMLGGERGRLARVRSVAAVVVVCLALLEALWLGPSINELFHEGARRGTGAAGVRLDELHNWAEATSKAAAVAAAVWIGLGMMMRRGQAAPESGSK
jgi:hypothetical protein